LYNGIKNNTLSGTGFGTFTNTAENIYKDNPIYPEALHYIHKIANTIS